MSKSTEGNRPRTWVVTTREGLRALEEHLSALRKRISQVEINE